jgi:hypothetical protein
MLVGGLGPVSQMMIVLVLPVGVLGAFVMMGRRHYVVRFDGRNVEV